MTHLIEILGINGEIILVPGSHEGGERHAEIVPYLLGVFGNEKLVKKIKKIIAQHGHEQTVVPPEAITEVGKYFRI